MGKERHKKELCSPSLFPALLDLYFVSCYCYHSLSPVSDWTDSVWNAHCGHQSNNNRKNGYRGSQPFLNLRPTFDCSKLSENCFPNKWQEKKNTTWPKNKLKKTVFRSSSLPAFRNPNLSLSRSYFLTLEVSLAQGCLPHHVIVSKTILCIRRNVSWLWQLVCATYFILKYSTWARPKITKNEMLKIKYHTRWYNWRHYAKSITELQDCLEFDPAVFTGQWAPVPDLPPPLTLFFLSLCSSRTHTHIQTHIRRDLSSL